MLLKTTCFQPVSLIFISENSSRGQSFQYNMQFPSINVIEWAIDVGGKQGEGKIIFTELFSQNEK